MLVDIHILALLVISNTQVRGHAKSGIICYGTFHLSHFIKIIFFIFISRGRYFVDPFIVSSSSQLSGKKHISFLNDLPAQGHNYLRSTQLS